MQHGKALTWNELADIYDKQTGGTARTKPMQDIFEWAEKQTDKFFVVDDELYLVTKEESLKESLTEKAKSNEHSNKKSHSTMKHPPKTIFKRRARKINPALIDQQFQYMSEEFEVGAWVDVQENDVETATEELAEYVESEISEDIEKAVQHLRKVARSRLYHEDAIKAAFTAWINENALSLYEILTDNLTSDFVENFFNLFLETLKSEQSKMY